MANRLKEDERNERIIRGLLKLPENRRCINCNSLGPQYVCTNFWTFVCTTCSGIHREFSHRVKSVSMAKFTSQEVSALQEGGNQRAKEIYLKEWDSQRNSLPDGSNVDRLRDFIKHVYVNGRFSGERTSDRPSMGKMGYKEDSSQGPPRSPRYEENYERRYSDRSSSGGRSPGYDQGSNRKSPAHPEIVNDWRREDRFNNGRKFDERRVSDGEPRMGGSPERPKDVDTSSPPVVRPVREILRENVLPLRIIEPPKPSSGARVSNSSVQTQGTASSTSIGSTIGGEPKPENPPASLIDFDANPEPPATAPLAPASVSNQGVLPTVTSTSDNNWASFDAAPSTAISQPPPAVVNSLDSVLLQLTGPSGGNSGVAPGVSGHTIPSVASTPGFPPSTSFPTVLPVHGVSMLPQGGLATVPRGAVPTLPMSSGNSSGVQPQQSNAFPSQAVAGTYQSTLPFGGASASQPWNAPVASNSMAPHSRVPSQVFNSAPNSTAGLNPGAPAQNPPSEVKTNSRKELPADLFTATYPSFPAHMMGWQAGIPYAMGYMQYHPVMPVPTLLQQSTSVNPFDGNNSAPVQAPTFPSMASLQGALPTIQTASGAPRPFNMGTPPMSWGSAQPPAYIPTMPPQVPAFPSALPPNAYVGQQVMGSNPPSRYPGSGAFGNEGAAFGSLGTNPLANSSFSAPYNQSSSAHVRGNPFG